MSTNDALKDLLKFNLIRIVSTDFSRDHYVATLITNSKVFWF
ncbi:MAG: hypothetical protein ACFE94_04570 [Candidatus Hodarchaeota archaeon]